MSYSCYSILFYFYLICSMQKTKRYTLHDALEAIVGDDSEFEGCDDSSDEDSDHPLYNRNSQDRERDESSEWGDYDRSESSTSNDVPQPNVNSGQQKTPTLEKSKKLSMEVMMWSNFVKFSHQTQTTKYLLTIFFSSAALVFNLLQWKVYFVGTLHGNIIVSVDSRVEKGERIVFVKWYDNKSVTLISSYCAVELQDITWHRSKADNAFVEVRRPHIVKEYITWWIYRHDCKVLCVQNTLQQKSFQAEFATSLILWQVQRAGAPITQCYISFTTTAQEGSCWSPRWCSKWCSKLHIDLWNVTSVAAANSAKSMQPPLSVRNGMCGFASPRK